MSAWTQCWIPLMQYIKAETLLRKEARGGMNECEWCEARRVMDGWFHGTELLSSSEATFANFPSPLSQDVLRERMATPIAYFNTIGVLAFTDCISPNEEKHLLEPTMASEKCPQMVKSKKSRSFKNLFFAFWGTHLIWPYGADSKNFQSRCAQEVNTNYSEIPEYWGPYPHVRIIVSMMK